MSCRQHGYPWSSLATSPYRSSPLASLQGYIPYPHIGAAWMRSYRANISNPLHRLFYWPPFEASSVTFFLWEIWALFLFTNSSAQAKYDTRSIFKRSLTGLNSEFSFSQTSCLTQGWRTKSAMGKPSLPIAGERIIGFIPFSRVLVLCEMLSVSSRIWTRVAVSISNNDNHYTTGTSYLDLGTIILPFISTKDPINT